MSTKTRSSRTKGSAKVSKLKDVVVEAIADKKGESITSLDLRTIADAVTDFFVICHATSKVQVKAIAEHVELKVKETARETPYHIEGIGNYEWVLIDYVDVVVHIFLKERREFYQLEELWHDARRTDYDL
ncbi:MAG: ribosomal silencing factor RsfS [Chitinophagales bacterium]|nr:MAG: ribosomal silencing factor RsfS [Chitinophagales bacterium]